MAYRVLYLATSDLTRTFQNLAFRPQILAKKQSEMEIATEIPRCPCFIFVNQNKRWRDEIYGRVILFFVDGTKTLENVLNQGVA